MDQHTWKTAKIINENNDAVTIVFEINGQHFQYKAGQFVNLSFEIDGEIAVRSYSLSSAPQIDKNPAITLKRVKGGLISNHVINNATSIKLWHLKGPYGMFVLPSNLTCQTLTFIAGGSGITPIFAMIKHALNQTSSPIILIYSNKTPGDIIFFNELESLKEQYPDRIKIQYIFTGNFIGEQLNTHVHLKPHGNKRINRAILKKLLGISKFTDFKSSLFFLCGPAGLIKTCNESLVSFGVPIENIYLEYFTAPVNEETDLLTSANMEVQLHFYERTNLLEVQPGQTILDSALKDYVPVPYSCKSGTCGICMAKVLAGKVHMQNNFALKEQMVQEGYVLLCQTYPLNDEVTVEIGG